MLNILYFCLFISVIQIQLFSSNAIFGSGYYGKSCDASHKCNDGFFGDNDYRCVNGRCNCTHSGNIKYVRYSGKLECYTKGDIPCEDNRDCGDNATCQERDYHNLELYQEHLRCVCNEGYIMIKSTVDKECYKFIDVTFNGECGLQIDGTINYCDVTANKTCLANKCQCSRSHFYDSEADVCITKEMYIEKYNEKAMAIFSESCDIMDSPKFCDENLNMTCTDGSCACTEDHLYDENTKSCLYRMDYILKHIENASGYNNYCEKKSPEKIPDPKFCNEVSNMVCRNSNCLCKKDYHIDTEKNICLTKEQLIEKFGKNVTAGVLEYCNETQKVEGLPKLCGDNAKCKNSKCICYVNHYENFTTKRCELKQNNQKMIHGHYCAEDTDCIYGLTCHEYRCACPYPCNYKNDLEACDCGEVSFLEGANYAIIVGVIGGIFIVSFWIVMIRKTMKKQSKADYHKTTSQFDNNPYSDLQQLNPTTNHTENSPLPPTHPQTPLYSFPTTTDSNNPLCVYANAPTNIPIVR